MSEHRTRADRGQATPLWAIVILLAGLLLIPTAKVARAALERVEAQSAADAAALAGALEDEDAARDAARANGATVVDYRTSGDRVEVVVRVGSHEATARAERDD